MNSDLSYQTVAPEPLTDSSANEQLLYFTTPSLTIDGAKLVLISDRFHGGGVNLACLDRWTREITPLTSFSTPPLQCYPYFDTDGADNRFAPGNGSDRVGTVGLNKSSPALHAESGALYYVYGRRDGWSEVCSVNVYSGARRLLAELPPDKTVAYTHISSDNRKLLLPVTDSRILGVGTKRKANREIFEYFLAHKLVTQFMEIDIDSGDSVILWEEPEWVTHVQYRPHDANCLLYNHEWRWPLGSERIWFRNKGHLHSKKMRAPDIRSGRRTCTSEDDNVAHEVWSPDGQWILYHGYGSAGGSFVGRISPNYEYLSEIWLAPEMKCAYGHFYHSPIDNRIVTDALSRDVWESSARGGNCISILTPDWEKETVHAKTLCEAGSSWRTQDDHPHPVISPNGSEVLFTSDKSGARAVYALDISETKGCHSTLNK